MMTSHSGLASDEVVVEDICLRRCDGAAETSLIVEFRIMRVFSIERRGHKIELQDPRSNTR